MTNPDRPWLCPQTITFLEKRLHRSMSALEFGSGRSTRWLAQRVGSITSVEYDQGWYQKVAGQLRDIDSLTVCLRYIALDHSHSEPEREHYESLPRYVAVLDEFPDHSLDLIVVDGHYRTTVLKHCGQKLKRGGLLLVDDVNLWTPGVPPVPPGFALVDRSSNGIKTTCVWEAPATSLRDLQ
jgi:predicted O-methyltransferase YrrM